MISGSWWVWFLLWFTVSFFTPRRKQQRGYVWRLLNHLPPWRFVPLPRREETVAVDYIVRAILRFSLLIWALLMVYDFLTPLSDDAVTYALYGSLILIELDDYINGDDDDRKRRREWARNKIKWLMDLPKPAHETGGAA